MRVDAVVLAAGSGKRMGGGGKALLVENGLSFLERVAGISRGGGCASVWVVIREGQPETEALAGVLDVHVVRNPEPDRGMFSSVQCALRAALKAEPPADGFLLFPVDHPRVMRETVHTLVRTFDENPRGAYLQPVHSGRGGHPIGVSAKDARTLLSFDPSAILKEALAQAGLVPWPVPVEDPGIRDNLNTPLDL